MSFKHLNLHPGILKALEETGYEKPTLIQEQAIPQILSGVDLRASAQTGTGKTAAFILPALHKLTTPSELKGRGPRVLVLVPTRELAQQVSEKAIAYSKHLPRMRTVCIYGGAPYPVQNRELSQHYEILVATPGRLIDHMERGRIDFSRLELLILDEADRMLDMGFIGPVEQIAEATPSTRQTLLFSATLKGSVMSLSQRLMNHPIEICVHAERTKHEDIEQRLLHVDNLNHKIRLLDHLLKDTEIDQAIVFTATKRHADELVNILLEKGHQAAALHGDMNQRQRTRTMSRMREGKFSVLVATDVAARGIDVQTISHVINFDLPGNAEDYVHRIGRTGRAGTKGIAWSFASGKDFGLLRDIEQFTGQKLIAQVIEGFEPTTRRPDRAPPGGGGGSRFRPRFQGNDSGRPPQSGRSNGFQGRPRSSPQDEPRRPSGGYQARPIRSADSYEEPRRSTGFQAKPSRAAAYDEPRRPSGGYQGRPSRSTDSQDEPKRASGNFTKARPSRTVSSGEEPRRTPGFQIKPKRRAPSGGAPVRAKPRSRV